MLELESQVNQGKAFADVTLLGGTFVLIQTQSHSGTYPEHPECHEEGGTFSPCGVSLFTWLSASSTRFILEIRWPETVGRERVLKEQRWVQSAKGGRGSVRLLSAHTLSSTQCVLFNVGKCL